MLTRELKSTHKLEDIQAVPGKCRSPDLGSRRAKCCWHDEKSEVESRVYENQKHGHPVGNIPIDGAEDTFDKQHDG